MGQDGVRDEADPQILTHKAIASWIILGPASAFFLTFDVSSEPTDHANCPEIAEVVRVNSEILNSAYQNTPKNRRFTRSEFSVTFPPISQATATLIEVNYSVV